MVWRSRWKVWGRGWAASPAITMSDRGCSQTPRSLSCGVWQSKVCLNWNKNLCLIFCQYIFSHSTPVLQFLCCLCFHHLLHLLAQKEKVWEMQQNARGYHAGRWSELHCTAASWKPVRRNRNTFMFWQNKRNDWIIYRQINLRKYYIQMISTAVPPWQTLCRQTSSMHASWPPPTPPGHGAV